jgi:hypothetical protein
LAFTFPAYQRKMLHGRSLARSCRSDSEENPATEGQSLTTTRRRLKPRQSTPKWLNPAFGTSRSALSRRSPS